MRNTYKSHPYESFADLTPWETEKDENYIDQLMKDLKPKRQIFPQIEKCQTYQIQLEKEHFLKDLTSQMRMFHLKPFTFPTRLMTRCINPSLDIFKLQLITVNNASNEQKTKKEELYSNQVLKTSQLKVILHNQKNSSIEKNKVPTFSSKNLLKFVAVSNQSLQANKMVYPLTDTIFDHFVFLFGCNQLIFRRFDRIPTCLLDTNQSQIVVVNLTFIFILQFDLTFYKSNKVSLYSKNNIFVDQKPSAKILINVYLFLIICLINGIF